MREVEILHSRLLGRAVRLNWLKSVAWLPADGDKASLSLPHSDMPLAFAPASDCSADCPGTAVLW